MSRASGSVPCRMEIGRVRGVVVPRGALRSVPLSHDLGLSYQASAPRRFAVSRRRRCDRCSLRTVHLGWSGAQCVRGRGIPRGTAHEPSVVGRDGMSGRTARAFAEQVTVNTTSTEAVARVEMSTVIVAVRRLRGRDEHHAPRRFAERRKWLVPAPGKPSELRPLNATPAAPEIRRHFRARMRPDANPQIRHLIAPLLRSPRSKSHLQVDPPASPQLDSLSWISPSTSGTLPSST